LKLTRRIKLFTLSLIATVSLAQAQTSDEIPWVSCKGEVVNPPKNNFRVLGVGDMVFSEDAKLNQAGFQNLVSEYKKNNFVFGNLEGVITTKKVSRKKYIPGRSYAFRFPPETAQLLKESGFHAVTLANNHALDFAEDGLDEGVKLLKSADVIPSGHQKGGYQIISMGGKRIALIGFGFYSYQNSILDIEAAEGLIKKAKQESDLVIVSMHGGTEGEGAIYLKDGPEFFLNEPRGDLRKFSQKAIASGADIIFGHGPHVVRGAECVGGKPVIYSVGNYVSAGGLSVRNLAGVATLGEFIYDDQLNFIGLRLLPVSFDKIKFPQYDSSGKGVLLTNYLSKNYADQMRDFNPILFKGFEDQLDSFGTWSAPFLRKNASLP
jgi:Bacterial capsule synthesis protein PGA_cap